MEMLRGGVASELWVVSSMMGVCACVWGLCASVCLCGCVFVHARMARPSTGCLEDWLWL